MFVEEVRIQTQLDPENGFTNAVKICIEKGILKEYLQRKSREVINMLVAEYDYDTDIAVQRAEAGRIAFAKGISQGIEQGISQGIEQGISQGIEQGAYQKARETAAAFKRLGIDSAKIAAGTGLTLEEIEEL